MPEIRRGTLVALVAVGAVAVIAVAACGGAAVSEGPTSPNSTEFPGDTGNLTPAPDAAMTITRTGGIAGVNDVVEIAADGTARVTRRDGTSGTCTPDAAALARLRAIDISAIGSPPPKVPIADGFNYEIESAAGTISVSDGDEGERAELLAAASLVVATCLTSISVLQ